MKKLLYTSLLVLFALVVQAQAPKMKTENVILLTLDGFRWQEMFGGLDSTLLHHKEFTKDKNHLIKEFWAETPEARREKLLPFCWNVIAKKGQLFGDRWNQNLVNVSNDQWFSYPGYSEILVGFHDKRINSNDKFNNPNTTVLEFINQQKAFAGKVAAFGSWDVFPFIINTERSKIPVNAGNEPVKGNLNANERLLNEMLEQIPERWGSVRFDAFTYHFAKEYMNKNQPRVMFISLGETDDFAHEGEYDEYIKSAYQTDRMIADLWDFVQNNPFYKDKTTLIISTDHGRGQKPIDTWKHHGQEIPESNEIWLAFLGPDTPALGHIKTPGQWYQNQIAQTMAAFLGLDYKNVQEVGKKIEQVLGK